MSSWRMGCVVLLALAVVQVAAAADGPAPKSSKEALQAFNDLIGSWRGTGEPEGTRTEKQRGFWVETISWEWQFKGPDAWLKVDFAKGKHFTGGTLRYLPGKESYQLTLNTPDKESLVFEGTLKDNRLTLDRVDEKKKEAQRLVFTLLHANRHLYRYEVRPENKTLYSKVYQVGATKEGVAFAGKGDGRPECVVSGGLGTMPVTHMGKTYYVCCTGCRDAFKDDPEKYIKEYEERKAKEKGK